MTTYGCPACPNKIKVGVRLAEPPRCINFEAHHHKRYVAMIEDGLTIAQQLEELL